MVGAIVFHSVFSSESIESFQGDYYAKQNKHILQMSRYTKARAHPRVRHVAALIHQLEKKNVG
eukprot:scaffold1568_cov200-Pinguiococcus_pyrenoidosus.AAC.1